MSKNSSTFPDMALYLKSTDSFTVLNDKSVKY
ncbi:hypothetical protein SAMN05444408_106176 [Chryseobacterium takakiae]|uniref:Uncharacterized protein n=1 Tax=Chryseobacterium takakiae TaxID=1302685 RepID=A0A1M4XPW2_9FLAO|nr:hypothetical protein SAMN05444408_106176 [Chryseobacterium takakiae]